MRLPAKSVAWVLPLFLAGCFHRTHQVQNQQLAPSLPPPQQLKVTLVDVPTADRIATRPTENAETLTEQAPKRSVRHHRPTEEKDTEETANVVPEPPAVSAIGQLSSGDPANYRDQTAQSINIIEHGLSGISHSLSSQDQKIADQIREYLKEARVALTSGDVDGAHTLAEKAKVLLAELTK